MGESRGGARRDLMLGIDRDERRGVAMVRLGVFEVLQPLLQLAVTSDLKGWELIPRALDTLSQVFIEREGMGCLDAHGVERVDEYPVDGVSHGVGRARAGRRLVPVLW